MRTSRLLLRALVSVGLMLPGHALIAQNPDNSAQNKDQSSTADKQSNAKADRMMTAQVRKAIVGDKGLSMYAHNVKVLVQNGTVTLKGPVRSDEEKQKVLSDAGSVVAADKISDQLTIKQ